MAPSQLDRVPRARLAGPLLLALAAGTVLVGLGTWQMYRKTWKDGLTATIAAGASAPPLTASEVLPLRCDAAEALNAAISPCEFRRLRLVGQFDHARERHVFAGTQRLDGKPTLGFFVFTPFQPIPPPGTKPRAGMILVNRGFVPEPLKAAATRLPGQVDGPVEITTQIRTRQTRAWFDGADAPGSNIYYVRDPRELVPDLASAPPGPVPGLDPRLHYLEIVDGTPPGGFPRPLAGAIQLTNRHLEYALTWYGLAATLAFVFAAFARTRLKSVDDGH